MFEILNPQERIVAEELMSGRLTSRERLCDLLWDGPDLPDSYSKVLSLVVHRVRTKLGVDIETFYREGYVMRQHEIDRIRKLEAEGRFARRRRPHQLRLKL